MEWLSTFLGPLSLASGIFFMLLVLSLFIGSWVIDGAAAGVGIRDSSTPATINLSCFVPRLFE